MESRFVGRDILKVFAYLRAQPKRVKLLYVLALFGIQIGLAALLISQIGMAGGTVSLLSILGCALLFGVRGGVLSVVIAIFINAVLGTLLIGESFFAVLRPGILIGIVALMVIGALVGYFSTLQLWLHNAHNQLEGQVAKRTAELKTKNTELQLEITERLEIEEALQRTKTTLEGANLARDRFLAGISHELRTPLTMILGQADALQEGLYGELNEEQQIAAEQVLQSSNHLLKLIDSILDYNRFSTQNVSIQRERVTINPICIAAIQMVAHHANRKKIELTLQDETEGLIIEVDEVQLMQMLVNLLDNAIKFTPDGGGVGLTVMSDPTASELPNGGQAAQTVSFAIWDTGIGLSNEDVDSVFEPFVQIQSDDQVRRSGAGLGLSLVQQMVDLHDGQISVASEKDQGSRFTITLPIQAA